ncbi:MAG: TolA-binding protein [Rhodothermales bacterium]|jgi:TolA-binding protein
MIATRILLTLAVVLLVAGGTTSCVSSTAKNTVSEAEISFDGAKKYYKKNQFEGAAAAFSQFVEDYADSPLVESALYYQGRSLAGMGEKDKAILVFERIVKNGKEFNDLASKQLEKLTAE